jgi:hypothetical protein
MEDTPFPAARGMGPVIVPNFGRGLGPLIQTHAGEGVLIVPRAHVGRVPGLFHAAKGFSRDPGDSWGGGGGSGAGGGSWIPTGGGGITTSTGDISFEPRSGRGGDAASDEAISSLKEEITLLKAAVEKAASAQPISIVSNPVISVEANPMKVRESAVEAEEFAVSAVVKQLQRKNADLVAEIRAIQRGG